MQIARIITVLLFELSYLSSNSDNLFPLEQVLLSLVNFCNKQKVCWNICSRKSSNSAGTQFFDNNSLIQFIARLPRWDEDELKLPPEFTVWPPCSSPPNPAKWNIVLSREGVINVDRGIQLKKWERQLRARAHNSCVSLSKGGKASCCTRLPLNMSVMKASARKLNFVLILWLFFFCV